MALVPQNNLAHGKYTLLSLIFCSFLLSCDTNSEETPVSEESLFSDKRWQMESATISPGFDFDQDGDLDTDLLSMLEICDADDITVYQSDKKILHDNGQTKCDSADPQQSVEGTWSYNNNTKKITQVDADGGILTLDVVGNTGETLTVIMPESIEKEKFEVLVRFKRVP